ncbi:Phosphoadenosine phosphosulfate reductase family protein [Halorientalis persicus]|uniref:Phosphoadenosine phosphosulfate reductase family protein n=1 Tax=Halorientalis persicus TaxID=1367881 RepID=A0A1H8U9D6_9EURY|nr:phosphoadenosine phosphosulfate reductase family protein [Halorientalis persicus]SEO99811.1 Phosphoadenosine phosphosulfate reductase family protein [Halorientalis persicus]
MIELDGYEEIGPPEETVQSEHLSKPEPSSDPVDIWEISRVLDTSGVGGGKDRAVLFSGGDDSLALTHLAMENDMADFVIHLATNSSLPANIDYVREICKKFNWPFFIISSPMPFDLFAYRYAFPGPSLHRQAYIYFKGRQLGYFSRHRAGGVKYFSGVRRLESDRRMENIEAEVQYEDPSNGGNFRGWWLSPLIDKSDEWVAKYRGRHNLPRNPVARKIHRSGDCFCLAYGHRDEELVNLQAKFPDHAEWLLNTEQRVQEYRGRVYLLEDEHPDIYEEVSSLRKQTKPNPMRLTVLKNEYPGIFDSIAAVDKEQAIQRGRLDETCYIGHGGMSHTDLRERIADADSCQQTLCETCQGRASQVAASVKRRQQEAAAALEENTIQQTITPETETDSRQQHCEPQTLGSTSEESVASRTTQVTLDDASR